MSRWRASGSRSSSSAMALATRASASGSSTSRRATTPADKDSASRNALRAGALRSTFASVLSSCAANTSGLSVTMSLTARLRSSMDFSNAARAGRRRTGASITWVMICSSACGIAGKKELIEHSMAGDESRASQERCKNHAELAPSRGARHGSSFRQRRRTGWGPCDRRATRRLARRPMDAGVVGRYCARSSRACCADRSLARVQ